MEMVDCPRYSARLLKQVCVKRYKRSLEVTTGGQAKRADKVCCEACWGCETGEERAACE